MLNKLKLKVIEKAFGRLDLFDMSICLCHLQTIQLRAIAEERTDSHLCSLYMPINNQNLKGGEK